MLFVSRKLSSLTGAEFINDLIEGQRRGCYDLRMNVGCFLQLQDEMKAKRSIYLFKNG